MSETEREELERTDVQHAAHKLKGDKEEIKKKAPIKLRRRVKGRKYRRRKRYLLGTLALFFFALGVFIFLCYDHYVTYPGIMARDSIHAKDRGIDYIELTWDEVRNTDEYKVYVKERISKEEDIPTSEYNIDDSWGSYSSKERSIKIEGLKEGTSYSFSIRPDNEKAEGLYTSVRNFRTKKTQKVTAAKSITKLTCSKPFRIDAEAETELMYESDNPEVAEITEKGDIKITGEGNAVITVHAKESEEFVQDSTEVNLQVLYSIPVHAGGAKAYYIHHLDSDNCDVVKKVTGAGGHVIPQSFGYSGDRYIIAYGMSGQGSIVTYPVEGDGEEGKEYIKPGIALNHPNGFAYDEENKIGYSVRGWSSRAITYDETTGAFGTMNFSYGCSGIGYDRKEKAIYTSSRTLMAAYDANDYSVKNTTGVVSHSGSWATQDVGGYGGIMIRCLSPSGNVHGTNCIDLYDMREGMYLGSFSCDLSEVESAIVNKDGFLEILANNSGNEDYIWRTDINIETLAEGIDYGE